MPTPETGRVTRARAEPTIAAAKADNRNTTAKKMPPPRDIHSTKEDTREESVIEEDAVLALLGSLPVDDEHLTEDDRRHIREGWIAYRGGKAVSAEDAKNACRGARGVKNGSKVKTKAPA